MITTLSEVKQILKIDSSNDEQDAFIEAAIPIIQKWVENELDNNFISDKVYRQSAALEFDGDNNEIIDENAKFNDFQFIPDRDYHVYGTYNNDGIYRVIAVTPDTLTVDSTEELINEDIDNVDSFQRYNYNPIIAKKEYPTGLKATIAKMIGFNIKNISFKSSDTDKSSESFRNYSYDKAATLIVQDSGDYPKHIRRDLYSYQNKSVKFG